MNFVDGRCRFSPTFVKHNYEASLLQQKAESIAHDVEHLTTHLAVVSPPSVQVCSREQQRAHQYTLPGPHNKQKLQLTLADYCVQTAPKLPEVSLTCDGRQRRLPRDFQILEEGSKLMLWREKIGFPVPVTHPEFNGHDPNLVHSRVLRMTQDRGLWYASEDCSRDSLRTVPGRWSNKVEAYAPFTLVNLELGVRGLSLSKHSTAHMMADLLKYPGMVRSCPHTVERILRCESNKQ